MELLGGCNHWVIEDLEEELEVSKEEIIKANKDLLLDVLQLKDSSEINMSKIEGFILSDYEPETITDSKKYLGVYCVYWVLKIARAKENLRNPEKDHLHNIYLLGAYRERLRIALYDLKYFDTESDWRHKIKSRLGMTKRWGDRKNQYEEALNIADKLWREGEPNLRHEMAKFLKTEVFPNLSYGRLQKELTPIAKKYDKLWDPSKPRKRKNRASKAATK